MEGCVTLTSHQGDTVNVRQDGTAISVNVSFCCFGGKFLEEISPFFSKSLMAYLN